MNKFQAMARIMALLSEGDQLRPGTQEYKIARKLIAEKIDRLGPQAALAQAIKWRGHILDRIKMMDHLKDLKDQFPFLPF